MEYESAGGSLKLKGDSKVHKKKKKKSKAKESKKKLMEEELVGGMSSSGRSGNQKTKAELAFEKAQHKKQDVELLKKAQKSHKERILDLNEKLDSLTEHYDIPKVSWTK